jgi:hypothetical protein
MVKYSKDLGSTFGWHSDSALSAIDQHKQNGLYCKSGMAYKTAENTAKCVITDHVMWNENKIPEPF